MSDLMSDLQKLAQHRDALLLAEVAAWLHMLGKFHEDFLKANQDLDIQLPHDLPTTHPNLDHLLRALWTGPIWNGLGVKELQANDLSIFDLAKEHRNPQAPTGLQRLLQDAHGRGSGIEKGVLNRFAPEQIEVFYLATALGRETRVDPLELQNKRQALYNFLQAQLRDLPEKFRNLSSSSEKEAFSKEFWRKFRPRFTQRLEQDFRTTVADKRRPLNDVTLFDQTMASVAFFKASLAQNMLLGWKDPTTKKQEEKYCWRILRVGLDGLAYWGQTARMSDLLARKALIAPVLDDVRTLLEEIYPLGMEIYRDENGSLFIVPDVERLLDYMGDEKPLYEQLQSIARRGFNGEVQFEFCLSEATRNTLSFGRLATKALQPPMPFLDDVKSWWNDLTDREVCPVCELRPQGPSAKGLERTVCDVCEQRRTERAREWGSKLSTTIWINEVADLNGRVALLVGRFGLESWLTGEAFDTVLAFDPSTRLLTDEKRNNKTYQFDYSQFLQEITVALSSPKANQPLGKWVPLLDNLLFRDQRGGFNKFSDIYSLYVSGTDLEGATPEAWRFALSLMRQQPAFARLRRVWETTQRFWETVLDEKDSQGNPLLPSAPPRLILSGTLQKEQGAPDPQEQPVCELLVDGFKLSVVWQEGQLIVCDNPVYFQTTTGKELKKILKEGAVFSLFTSEGYKKRDVLIGKFTIEKVEQQTTYIPVIPILAEPQIFMALVPADKALEVVRAIKEKYEHEMGKVQNRLPLFLGLVFFHRRTPLPAVMDTARRMPAGEFANGEWRITNTPQNDGKTVTLSLEQNGQRITLQVPIVMGDGTTEDVWYPYFELVGQPAAHHTYRFQRDGVWWVHVKTLQKGETVRVTPSRFAYLFLESTAQRFRFDPEKDALLLDELPRLMEMWNALKKSGITDTGLRNVQALLESKSAAWGRNSTEFEHLTRTTLKQAGLFERKDKEGNPLPDVITPEDVLSGRLARCLELYLHILKLRLKEA